MGDCDAQHGKRSLLCSYQLFYLEIIPLYQINDAQKVTGQATKIISLEELNRQKKLSSF